MSFKETSPIDFDLLLKDWAYIVFLKSKGQFKKAEKFQKQGKFPNDVIIELNWERANLEFCQLVTTDRSASVTPRQVYQSGDYYCDLSKQEPTISYDSTTDAYFDVTVVEGKTSGLALEGHRPDLTETLRNLQNSPFGNVFPLSTEAKIPSEKRQQSWGFNTKVQIDQNVRAKATLIVRESRHQGEFICTAKLSGKLSAKISKKNGSKPTVIDAADFMAIHDIFKSSYLTVNSINQLRVNRDEKSLDWAVKGTYSLTYGMGNSVEITKVAA